MDETTKSGDILITQKMLEETRSELKSNIASLSLKMDAKFDEVKAEINGMKADIHEVKSDIHEVKADINEVKSDIKSVVAMVHRNNALAEQQRAENRAVLDAYKEIASRQERFEDEATRRFDEIETAFSAAKI